MTAEEYKAKLRQALRELDANREAETLRITFDLMAQVKNRIQTSGTDYTGAMFPPYTPSYAKSGRVKMGYQIRYVDFTRQGRLWASIFPIADKKTESAVGFSVRPRDSENQDKLNGQFAKRGNILLPSKDEIAVAQEANNRRVQKYLRQIGL